MKECEIRNICHISRCPEAICGLLDFFLELAELKKELRIRKGHSSTKSKKRIAIAVSEQYLITTKDFRIHWLERQLYENCTGLTCDPLTEEERLSMEPTKYKSYPFDPLKLHVMLGPREPLGRFPLMIIRFLKGEHKDGEQRAESTRCEGNKYLNRRSPGEVSGDLKGSFGELENELRASIPEIGK